MNADHREHERREGSRIIDPEQELTSLRFVQEDVLNRTSVGDPLPKDFGPRIMALDSAVAPLLPSPITPFQKSERKKAHTSAMYYSECFLKGVTPTDADNAASDIEGRYNKWWVQEGFHEATKPPDTDDTINANRDEKTSSSFNKITTDDATDDSTNTKRPRHVSESTEASKAVGKKRMRRRGGIRDVIQVRRGGRRFSL